jgi:hypothetical protein
MFTLRLCSVLKERIGIAQISAAQFLTISCYGEYRFVSSCSNPFSA